MQYLTKTWLLVALLFSLISGNFWIYPRGVSMDWDSTLAHQPYHTLRTEALAFIETQNIEFSALGTAFPNINTGENLMLNGDLRQFSEKDFSQNRYMMTSNIYNDFSEADYAILARHWRLIWRVENRGVWIEIYEKR